MLSFFCTSLETCFVSFSSFGPEAARLETRKDSTHHEEVLRPDWLEAQYRHCSDCGCRFRIVRLRPGKAHSHDFAHTVIDNPRVYSEDFSPYQASLNTSRRSMSRVPARPRPRTRLLTSRASQSADTLWDVSLVLLPRSGSVSLPLSSSHMYSN